MVQKFYIIAVLMNRLILLTKITGAEVKNDDKIELFQRFIGSYKRVYPDEESERKGFSNFVNNLALVNRLNSEHPGKVIAYELNRYADVDAEEINERYGLEIRPYDNMEHGNKKALERERHHKFLEDMHLYDLHKVDDLFKNWTEEWDKPKFTKKLEDMARYYRFVKTLVEINRKKFEGRDASLDEDADVIREPDQYFFG